jgi:hypothetical protein
MVLLYGYELKMMIPADHILNLIFPTLTTLKSFLSSCKFLNIVIYRARIFKRLWSPGIDSKASIPPAYVAWRAGTITLFLLGAKIF